MAEYMDKKIISLQNRWNRFLSDFISEERGESNFVAVLLIILIAVAVAYVFKDKLISLVGDVFKEIKVGDLSSH